MNAIVAWAVALMISWSPPGRSLLPEARETEAEGRARYEEIARAAAEVAHDPAERPVFGGPSGRGATLALLLAVASFESGFRRDVDLGLGARARGEGVDSCLLQLRVGRGRTAEGWSHAELVADRRRCFRAGLALMRRSFGACRQLAVLDRLSAYATGRCTAAQRHSRARVGRAQAAGRPPLVDAAVLGAGPS